MWRDMAMFSEKELYVTFCKLISGGKRDENSYHANQLNVFISIAFFLALILLHWIKSSVNNLKIRKNALHMFQKDF